MDHSGPFDSAGKNVSQCQPLRKLRMGRQYRFDPQQLRMRVTYPFDQRVGKCVKA